MDGDTLALAFFEKDQTAMAEVGGALNDPFGHNTEAVGVGRNATVLGTLSRTTSSDRCGAAKLIHQSSRQA